MLDPRAFRRFQKNRGAVFGTGLVVVLVLFAVLGPLLAGHDPNLSDFTGGRAADGSIAGPSGRHLLGVDPLLRDSFSRLAHGARISLLVAFFATTISIVVGAAVGLASGYAEGTRGQSVDTFLMRAVDVGLSFPYLLLVMAIGAAVGETTIVTILMVLGLTSWFGTARIIRSKTIQVRHLDFIVASRALGQSTPAILLRHILPNVAGPLIVIASASVAQMIIAESVLSYLQVGLPPPTATWGRMLLEGQRFYTVAPRLVLAPGILIFLAVLGFNLLGEGLRDALDPHED
ncbi:MAG: ABC transporter permease [Polyangiaceae bacterium]|nr:ABC transporter permease [Myxococcales bacterium]MCC6900061.1 ABC transporter permease [Polyangiaceae bacterium]